jgi:hypothetical protein
MISPAELDQALTAAFPNFVRSHPDPQGKTFAAEFDPGFDDPDRRVYLVVDRSDNLGAVVKRFGFYYTELRLGQPWTHKQWKRFRIETGEGF